jgi:uncharacterized SAM-binding protein YcdF (DUF218 family)
MKYLLAALGLLSVGYGLCVMSLFSGTRFFVVWLVLGALLLALAWALHAGLWAQWPAWLRGGIVALGIAGVLATIGLSALSLSQAHAAAEPDLDYLIVLGSQVRADETPSPVLQYRLDAAATYLQANPRTRCDVSGGKGPNEPVAEAACMAAYLQAQGIEPARILQEDRSTDTNENIRYSAELLPAQGDDPATARVGLVTNNFHVFRSLALARKQGYGNVCGLAAYATPFYLPNNVFRECFGIAKDWLCGNI